MIRIGDIHIADVYVGSQHIQEARYGSEATSFAPAPVRNPMATTGAIRRIRETYFNLQYTGETLTLKNGNVFGLQLVGDNLFVASDGSSGIYWIDVTNNTSSSVVGRSAGQSRNTALFYVPTNDTSGTLYNTAYGSRTIYAYAWDGTALTAAPTLNWNTPTFDYRRNYGASNINGAWYHDNIVWLADNSDRYLYAFRNTAAALNTFVDDGLLDTPLDFNNLQMSGTNGIVYLTDSSVPYYLHVFALNQNYHWNKYAIVDLRLVSGNRNINTRGVATDGTFLYIADSTDALVYKYRLPGLGTRPFDNNFQHLAATATGTIPIKSNDTGSRSIQVVGNRIYVNSYQPAACYSVDITTKVASANYTLATNSAAPIAFFTVGTSTLYMSRWPSGFFERYTIASDGTLTYNDFWTATSANRHITGAWFDDSINRLFVADESDRRIYVYDYTPATRAFANVSTATIQLDFNPYGLHGTSRYLFTVDSNSHTELKVLHRLGNTYQGSGYTTLRLPSRMGSAHGVTGTGNTLYLLDRVDKLIYTFTLN